MTDNKLRCTADDCMLRTRVISEVEQRQGMVVQNVAGTFHPECFDEQECKIPEALTEPPAGTWASVAREMANIFGDDEVDWDRWKDEMKESM